MLKRPLYLGDDGKKHKYEANIVLNPDNENDFYTITQFSRQTFSNFLAYIRNELDYLPDDAYAIVFYPDFDDVLGKLIKTSKFGYILVEDLQND